MGMRNREGIDRVQKALTIRKGYERDLTYVRDIDLKSSHYPWPGENWQVIDGEGVELFIASLRSQPVAFIVTLLHEDEIVILRLGVRPDWRGYGIGTKLFDRVKDNAAANKCSRLVITVPEILCLPGHPDDVSQWLSSYGFRTECPIVKDFSYMYGQWVDGYRFVCKLGEQNGPSV